MKVITLQNFRDKDNFTKAYIKGETYDFPDKRAKELIKSGLVQVEGESTNEGDENLTLKLEELVKRETTLVTKESELATKLEELATKEKALNSREEALKAQAEELEQSDLESREAFPVSKEEAKSKK